MLRPLRLALVFLAAACSSLASGCDDGASNDTDAAVTSTGDTAGGGDTSGADTGASNTDTGSGADIVAPSTLADCTDWYTDDLTVEFLQLESADGAVKIRIARFIGDGTAVGETFPLELGAFGIERDGELTCVTDRAALGYEFGHHNWAEVVDVTLPDGTAVHYTMTVEFTDTDIIWNDVIEATGTAPFGPLELSDTDCRTEPASDPNFCFRRTRSD